MAAPLSALAPRCAWVRGQNETYLAYHDNEWGVPVHDDRKLFELLLLEAFQAGLSWACVLNKRNAFRQAFDGFDPEKIASYGKDKTDALAADPGIIRNRKKIEAAVKNAGVFLAIQKEFGSFDAYLRSFTDGAVVCESYALRTTSPLSDALSKDLKKRGMSFVGSTVLYSYLQAVGVINGHGEECALCPAKTIKKQTPVL